MSKRTMKKRLSVLEAKAERMGAYLDHSLYDFEHLDCFWYDGNSFVSVGYKGYSICFDVCGDVRISVEVPKSIDADGYVVIRHKGGGEPLYFNGDARSVIKNDAHLRKLIAQNRIHWENNNWINVIIINQATSEEVSEPYVSDSSNLLESAEMEIDCCMEYIDKMLAEMSGSQQVPIDGEMISTQEVTQNESKKD